MPVSIQHGLVVIPTVSVAGKRDKWTKAFISLLLVPALLLSAIFSGAQRPYFSKEDFFREDSCLDLVLTTDLKKLIADREKPGYESRFQPGVISLVAGDSSRLSGDVMLRARGDFRREMCTVPPVKIDFRGDKNSPFKKLGCLKLVWPCDNTLYNEQLVLKEYLAYRMYNQLTDMSFRVRLVRIRYEDTKERIRSRQYYGFFIEDVDAMAKRNGCREIETLKLHTEKTNRPQTTLMTIFQYMIGNTDWSVYGCHNIKLILSEKDSLSLPYAVPYDLDCNGFVNADYALPAADLDLASVRQRLYRGYSRSIEELEPVLKLFRDKKSVFEKMISGCEALLPHHRKQMINYLEEFYSETKTRSEVAKLFIHNARKE